MILHSNGTVLYDLMANPLKLLDKSRHSPDFGFYPSAIKAVGYSDHQRRAVERAGSQKFSSY